MNRPDAVDVIDKALGENKEGGTPSAEGEGNSFSSKTQVGGTGALNDGKR